MSRKLIGIEVLLYLHIHGRNTGDQHSRIYIQNSISERIITGVTMTVRVEEHPDQLIVGSGVDKALEI